MKRIRWVACVLVICILICCGCSKQESSTEDDTDLSSAIDEGDALINESQGNVMLGFQESSPDEYTYTGSELEVPLYVGAEDNIDDMEVAAMLFLNGEVQPFSYELDGEMSETKLVHHFTLGPDQVINFTAHVTPVSGNQGEVVGMQFAMIFKSDYLPDSEGNTSFGNCGKINSTISLPVNMQEAAENNTVVDSVEASVVDIPDEVMEMQENFMAEGTDNPLDYGSYLEIKMNDDKNVLHAENGKLHLTMQAYGGKEVASKITFFINNEPVKVDGCDYVSMHSTSDKMTVFDVTIDVSEYETPCSFYAVAATSGEDYLIQDDLIQSQRCLLLNE